MREHNGSRKNLRLDRRSIVVTLGLLTIEACVVSLPAGRDEDEPMSSTDAPDQPGDDSRPGDRPANPGSASSGPGDEPGDEPGADGSTSGDGGGGASGGDGTSGGVVEVDTEGGGGGGASGDVPPDLPPEEPPPEEPPPEEPPPEEPPPEEPPPEDPPPEDPPPEDPPPATEVPVCGDGIADEGEECDGLDLVDTSCQSFGQSGQLACADDCTFDLSGCMLVGDVMCGNPGGGALLWDNGTGTGVLYCYDAGDTAEELAQKACESHYGMGHCCIITGGYQDQQFGPCGGDDMFHWHWDAHLEGDCAPEYVVGDVVSPGWCGAVVGNLLPNLDDGGEMGPSAGGHGAAGSEASG